MVKSYKLMKGLVKTWSDKNKPDGDYDGASDSESESESEDGDGRDTDNLPYVTQKTWAKHCETPVLRLLHEGSS
jgi:hypothetical protein